MKIKKENLKDPKYIKILIYLAVMLFGVITGSGAEALIRLSEKTINILSSIKLPDNTPSDATITTKSEGYMQKLISQNDSLKDIDSGLVITEANTRLSNGMATVRVINTFDVTGTYGSMIDKTLSNNPNRTYTIKFTKFNFLKGDIDRNGVVDANDASLALEKYKINQWSQDDLKYGDMDENNLIDANDASLILEVYKTNN